MTARKWTYATWFELCEIGKDEGHRNVTRHLADDAEETEIFLIGSTENVTLDVDPFQPTRHVDCLFPAGQTTPSLSPDPFDDPPQGQLYASLMSQTSGDVDRERGILLPHARHRIEVDCSYLELER